MNGTDFLGLVFSDPVRWGLAFESLVGIYTDNDNLIKETRHIFLVLSLSVSQSVTKGSHLEMLVHLKINHLKKSIQVTLTMAEIHMADHDGAQGLLFRPVKVHIIILIGVNEQEIIIVLIVIAWQHDRLP